jgi:UDP-N-acetylmuramoyl-L-alanyl-D-glutamate--2,6-diaminopimelate ligase
MKLLRDILYKTRIEEVIGSTNVAIASICFDSRKVEKFSLFVAVKGEIVDGHAFIVSAASKGAVAIVCEKIPDERDEKITYIKVKDSSEALAWAAANFYDNPSEKLKLIGVTGTNGKTTTVTLLYQLFKLLGYKTGMLSTVNNSIDGELIPATHTTPDALHLNELLQKMVEKGCTHCFMEVSSHAVVQHRITALEFAGAAFTNITHDHLDYHKTFDNYIKAKKGFFDMLSPNAFALVNKDDKNGEVMLQNTRAVKKTYALNSIADFKCKIVENQFSGLILTLDGKEFYSKLIGSFNAYNLLLAYSVGVLLKEDSTQVLTALSTLNAVEGRFQYIRSNSKITGIVDYAHTPDALKNVLNTIQDIRTGNEKVITLVGCGGDRDALKRPIMARIACELSDKVILTSDNPRSENPEEIVSQMKQGIQMSYAKKSLAIVDRREAIKTACSLAQPGDIILVAGKGHEKYQEIKGVKYPFDDMEELKNAFELLS